MMADLMDAADASTAPNLIRESHALPVGVKLPYLSSGSLAVVRARMESGLELTTPIAPQDAYLVTLHLADVQEHQFWADGRRVSQGPLARGDRVIVDLTSDPTASVTGGFDALHLFLPRSMLAAAAKEEGGSFSGLNVNRWCQDHVLQAFGEMMREVLGQSGSVAQTVFEEAGLAMMWHLLERASPSFGSHQRKGLSRAEVRRATEMLSEDVSLESIARACGIPPAQLVRSFKLATGTTPAEWKRARRIDDAKQLLFGTGLSIGEIAVQCGYSEKSHLVRSFHRATGHTPVGWRKARHM